MYKPVVPVEACTGSACAGCLQPGKNLKCCSKCQRAWYCSKDCQKSHWSQWGHKQACASAAPVLPALAGTIAAANPAPSSYDEVLELMESARYAIINNPALHRDVYTMFDATVFCRVCFRTREQLPPEQRRHFRCCPDCGWGWCCCEQHWQQHKQQHAQHCSTYAAMAGCSLLSCKHLRQHGEFQGFCPQGKMQQQQQLPRSWPEYVAARHVPQFLPLEWLCMTEGLSIPLTAALACSVLYSSSQLQQLQEFTLHLVGSSQYETWQFARLTVGEELMHLLPAVKTLHVVLIGPGLASSNPSDSTYLTQHADTCPACEAAGCKRLYSFYRGPYEDFAASRHWSAPSLALACNSGIGEEGTAAWLPAVQVLLRRDVPSCFTSFQDIEAPKDAAVLRAAGAHIVHGPAPNPFKSLVPPLDSALGPDRFYYRNALLSCFKGRAGSGSRSSISAAGKKVSQTHE